MTALTQRKTRLVFESADIVREAGKYREVVVEAHPMFARIRLKGMRSSYDVPWSSIWSVGVKAETERVRREKKARKA